MGAHGRTDSGIEPRHLATGDGRGEVRGVTSGPYESLRKGIANRGPAAAHAGTGDHERPALEARWRG